MYETIIWATDGSELADGALPFALALAERDDAELVVLHINEVTPGRAGGYPVLTDEAEIRPQLEARVERLRDAGVSARFEVVTALGESVPSAIAQVAEQDAGDLIVIGTHGRGTVGSLVHGNVTRRLVHLAACPVLAVPVGRLAAQTNNVPVAFG